MSAPLRSEPSSNRHAGTPRPASATAPSPPFGSKPAVAKTAARPRSSSNAPNASNTSIRPSTDTRPMPRLSRSELADFTVQLAVMIRTGLDVATALTSLCRLAGSKRTRRLYERLADDVIGRRHGGAPSFQGARAARTDLRCDLCRHPLGRRVVGGVVQGARTARRPAACRDEPADEAAGCSPIRSC